MNRKMILFFLFFSIIQFNGQDIYSQLRKKYWQFEENDQRAFVYIDLYVSAAKKEKNYKELYQAYDDAKRFSPNEKLLYADSAIAVAKLSRDNDLIGNGYIGKGTIYYFNYRKFQLALSEYLKAYELLKNSKNDFLKYQNLYHIGVVKSYLGYHNEALSIFEECISYFKPKTTENLHPNLIKNYTKGYLNCLHQMIICYQAINNKTNADRLIIEGISGTPNDEFYYIEKSYFLKAKAISEYQNNNFSKAIADFDAALAGLMKKNDFTWTSVAWFYKGKSYQKLNNENLAIDNFKKVDSIFNKYHFILPELRKNYEELINFYKSKNDPKLELYYTNQLLKADEFLSTDFKNLSSIIHKEYDTKSLLEAKADLENTTYWGRYLLILSTIFILIGFGYAYYWFKRRKDIQKHYDLLEKKLNAHLQFVKLDRQSLQDKTSKLDPAMIKNLEKSLDNFERKELYLEKGLTLSQLASQIGTNTSYLSQFINEFKGCNFNTYINTLRIVYATDKIYNDKKWRKYSVEDIAEDCGFSNRQSFSNVFLEQNGIRPNDFIKKRKEELETQKVS